ncbi:MAG: BON domain-containing protein [Pseudomonadota bacterium]|nr:BON domain-containing protein [Pseudomonadota bacterium]
MFRLFALILATGSLFISGCHNQGPSDEHFENDEALSAHLRSINKNSARLAKVQQSTQAQSIAANNAPLEYDDQKLSHEVLAALLSQEELRKSHIKVASYFGDILILGEVPDQKSIELAQNIAASFEHVKTIKTSLTIGENISQSQRALDSITNTKIKTAIAQLDIEHSHLNITTNNNMVFVLGQLPKENQDLIQKQLSNIPEIQGVYFY